MVRNLSYTKILLTLLAYFFSLPKNSLQGEHEKRLLSTLLDKYQQLERPVRNETEPLQLSFGLTLMQIIDVDEKNQILMTNTWLTLDEKNQILVTSIWLKLVWNDYNLQWKPEDYGNITDLRIPPHRIWKPDVLMYNSADEQFDGTYQTNVVVLNNGSCTYIPPGIFKSTCKIDITWFPFDEQKCDMKFGSWTYDGGQLDLQLHSEDGGEISSFIANGEWSLIGVPGIRHAVYYACCPDPYVDITFTVHIQRRTLYYFFNLIVPCVLIASMAVLGFTLPPDSGEKLSLGVPGKRNVKYYACCPEPYVDAVYVVHIQRRTLFYLVNLIVPGIMISSMTLLGFTLPHECGEKLTLGVTILLSLTVFLNMVAETMPATSDAVPLLGVTILLSLTVFHNLVAETLPQVSDALPVLGTYFNCIMFMVASSVVSTILILNYHHRNADTHEMSQWVRIVFLQWMPWLLRMSRPGDKITLKAMAATAKMRDQIRELEMKERSSKSLLANVLDMDDDFRPGTLRSGGLHSTPGWRIGGSHEDPIASTVSHHPCLGAHRELSLILKEIRLITDKIRKDDEAAEITSEWKFAAMVVDRLCLIIFTLFTIIATVAVLASAPQVFVP